MPTSRVARPTLRALASVFLRYGSFTFGGGSSTVIAVEREVVDQRQWIDRPTYRMVYGLARLTPGTSILATCTGVGLKLWGWRGAAVALVAASLPCALLAALVTIVYEALTANAWARAALHGATAAAVGIVGASCWHLVRPYLTRRSWARSVVLVAGSAMLSILGLPPVRVLLIASIVGVLWRRSESA